MAHVRILKHYFHVPFLLLGMLECFILFSSVYLAAWLRFDGFGTSVLEDIGSLMPRAFLFGLLVMISMTALGVYQARAREGLSGVMLRTGVSYFLAAAALSFTFYLFPSLYLGRGVFILAAFLSFITIFILRMVLARLVDERLLKRRVLVLGAGRRAKLVEERLQGSENQRGFLLCGFVAVPDETIEVDGGRVIPLEGSLLELAARFRVDELVVAIDDRRRYFPMKELLDCKMGGIDVLDIINFFEREGGQIEVGLLHPSWLVFSDGFMYGASRAAMERCFDMVASAFLLLLTWPVMLATMLAIWWEDGIGADVFYRQKRVGLNEKEFFVYKFRSMRTDAEAGGAQWALSSDDRITRVGQVIRKYRIDELPQILNVLKGDMGFVGPRPERPEFVKQLAEHIPFYADRHRVKPGITGWAQLRYPYGASEEDARMKLKYDLYYVKNHSLMLDFLILIQTVEVVLFGKGAR